MATSREFSGMIAETSPTAPVRKSIRVRANAPRAFKVFTEGFDSWWPRSHHIGSSPMVKTFLEGKVGGRCYSLQQDGSECDWAQITAWEPPARFVMAWLINGDWKYEPDLSKCSEVEVTFTPERDGSTLVELEHRHFERMVAGAETMRSMVNQEGGWSGLLALYQAQAEREEQAQ
jgi:uncharacterized protein YndB with AHSA1/START domain